MQEALVRQLKYKSSKMTNQMSYFARFLALNVEIEAFRKKIAPKNVMKWFHYSFLFIVI